jgi:hypothetical protein
MFKYQSLESKGVRCPEEAGKVFFGLAADFGDGCVGRDRFCFYFYCRELAPVTMPIILKRFDQWWSGFSRFERRLGG